MAGKLIFQQITETGYPQVNYERKKTQKLEVSVDTVIEEAYPTNQEPIKFTVVELDDNQLVMESSIPLSVKGSQENPSESSTRIILKVGEELVLYPSSIKDASVEWKFKYIQ